MTNKFAIRSTAFLASAAISVDQALAMAWPWHPKPDYPGHSGPATAPELDGPGGIAAIVFLVSVAIVLFNRSRNR